MRARPTCRHTDKLKQRGIGTEEKTDRQDWINRIRRRQANRNRGRRQADTGRQDETGRDKETDRLGSKLTQKDIRDKIIRTNSLYIVLFLCPTHKVRP